MPMARARHELQEGAGQVEIELACEAPLARRVFVAGDFNHWRPYDLMLHQDETGTWRTRLLLTPGRYEYGFIVDGKWQGDPNHSSRAPDGTVFSNFFIHVHKEEVNF
jgi:1,4-alpha-glucan branching enzyme